MYIEKCNLHHSRRCGIVPTGKHLYIRDNKLHHISGVLPGCVIDVEDGYGLNQNIRIYNNHLFDSRIGVAFVSTQHVYFLGNYMERLGQSTVWGECRQVHISQNIIRLSSWDFQGEVLFNGNNLFHSSVSSRKKASHLISSNYFYNSSLKIDKDLPFTSIVSTNYFHRDITNISEEDQTNDFETYGTPQLIQDNLFDVSRVYNYSDNNGWLYTNNKFNLINGPIGVTICPGIYNNCYIDCSNLESPLQFRVNNGRYIYEFIGCTFNDTQFFASYDQPMELLRFDQCDIYSTQNRFVYFRDMNGTLEFTRNRFIMTPESDNPESIISFLSSRFTSCERIFVKGNTFSSKSVSMGAMTLSEYPIPDFQFRDNTLDNVTLIPNNKHVILANNYIDGIKDPYFIFSQEPTSGYFRYRQKLEEATLTSGGYIGWIVIKEGTANNVDWLASTAYSSGELVNANEKVYQVISAGTTSTSPPNHTSGTAIDGTVTWEYVSDKAVIKQYGKIED